VKPLLWSLAAIIITALVCWRVPTAREVVGETALTIFQVLTTPFILELSVAFLGICVVITLNQMRLERDKDEWVPMHVPDSATAERPEAAPPEGATKAPAPERR
jgi:hypothetical protein